MCGIAGIISDNPSFINKETLCRMTDSIAHRGPDGEQHWINSAGTTGFGHRRLAILDLSSAGLQPMHYQNRYTILHNGEIYNYLELRNDLKKKGYQFESDSDTEVILAAYACYGQDCCAYFDGMFAFIIWDEQEREVFAARDRFGEKPFYYVTLNDRLIFASEIKAIRAVMPGLKLKPSEIISFLTLGHTRKNAIDGQTIYDQVSELPPASTLHYKLTSNKPEISTYWQLEKKTNNKLNEHQVIETFRDLWSQSLKIRLRSDVELGCSLSGGLDSSSIVAGINRFDKHVLKTYSAVFPGFARDESHYVDIINKQFNTEPTLITPDPQSLLNDLERFIWHQETFISSASVYAQYAVFKSAKENGTVVLLDGQGADETLAGYNKYIHWGLQELYRHDSKNFQTQLAEFRNNKLPFEWSVVNKLAAYQPSLTAFVLKRREARRIKNAGFISKEYLSLYYPGDNLYGKPRVEKLNDILYHDTIVSGLHELLHYADRNSMAHGREVRLPFLSHQLVSFLFTLPIEYKLREGFTKWILRKTMSAVLPEQISWRKDKIGYEPPQKAWMAKPGMQERIHESKRKLVAAGVLEASIMHKKIQPQDSHAADNYDWRFLVTGLLLGQ